LDTRFRSKLYEGVKADDIAGGLSDTTLAASLGPL
jgi:hypothetical protein